MNHTQYKNRSKQRKRRIVEGVDVAIVEGWEAVVGEGREVDIVVRVHFEASAEVANAATAEEASANAANAANVANAVDTLVLVRMSSLYFLRNY